MWKKIGIAAGALAVAAGLFFGGKALMRNKSDKGVVTGENKWKVEELSYFDGLDKLYGKIYTPSEMKGPFTTVIFCHGISATGDWGSDICKSLASNGFAAYAFDFRGGSAFSRSSSLGTSEMSLKTEVDDLKKVIKKIAKEDFCNGKIVLMGHSLGGLTALQTAATERRKIDGLVLLAPAMNAPDDARKMYPKMKDIPDSTEFMAMEIGHDYFAVLHRLDPYKAAAKCKVKTLLIQGTEDKMVPKEYSDSLSKVLPAAEYKVIEGADHSFTGKFRGEMVSIAVDWIKNL
jgi:pimeloyl-ACP methyl ester carboxylesterase